MLSLLSSVVAPEVPPVQDIDHHWNQFLHYYASRPVAHLKKDPVEETKLVFHLQKMLKLLMEEQSNTSAQATTSKESPTKSTMTLCPCLEYVLNQNVLDTLVTLCQADSPPGIRPFIFNVFIFLLQSIRYPLLPEAACHQPLRRLVLVCTLTKASPTETQEIKFITMLCGKVRETPDLIHIFLDSSCVKEPAVRPCSFDTSRQDSGRTSRSGEVDMHNIEKLAINVRVALDSLHSRHILAAALTNYIDSADYVLALQAMEALLIVVALDSDIAAQALVAGSPLFPTLMDRLECLHSGLSDDMDPSRLEEIQVSWAQVHHLYQPAEEDSDFTGRAEVLLLFGFLDYLDSVVAVAHNYVASCLSQQVRENFFIGMLQPRLESDDETTLLLGLALTAQVWLHIKSDQLTLAFSSWLLGDNFSLFASPVLHRLLSLCPGPGLTGMETVRLFDVLLSAPSPYILDRLVTFNMETRGYHLGTCLPESQITSWSDIEDERERTAELSSSSSPSCRTERSLTPSKTLAPSNIHRLVNAWLFLVPDILRLDEVRGSGYDQYVQDARRQVEMSVESCVGFDWPREAAVSDRTETSSSDSRIENDPSRLWSEGPFLATILDLLSQCLHSTYDSNLQLTSVLSRLAQLPHPNLHEYLLNPTIPLVPGVRTLYSVLKAVLAKAVTLTENIQHFPKKMYWCRKKLLGDHTKESREVDEVDPEEMLLLEAILVIDEFCKELAAVTFVKYHCFSSGLR